MADPMTNGQANGHEANGAMPLRVLSGTELAEVAEIRAAASTLVERAMFARQAGLSFDGARDLYSIFGYPRVLTYRMMRAEYMRGGIAQRIVDAYPKATWRGGVTLFEDEDPKVTTPFEQAWLDLEQQHQIWSMLQRADILAGLSTYGVLLIGAPGDLSTPLPKGKPGDLLYFSPFSGGGGPGGDQQSRAQALDADCSIMTFDTDTQSPRFGLPLTYQLRRTELSSPMLQRPVHFSRILHIAEGLLGDNVYGTPTLESVFNLLIDLNKVTGGGAEAYFLRANPGMHVNIDKDMQLPTPKPGEKSEVEKMRESIDEYKFGFDRWFKTRGTEVTPLSSSVADFHSPADAILTQIAGTKGIPKRILLGSEMGQLASGQDKDNFNTAVQDRRTSYAGPSIVRLLADRLIEYGYLPKPAQYDIKWPVIEELSEDEKAKFANDLANVNKSYGATIFDDVEIREMAFGKEPLPEKQPWENLTEQDKANLAKTLALVNKEMGITVYTDDEIRKMSHGLEPLSDAEKVPIGAPEKVSVTQPPKLGADGLPVVQEGQALVAPNAATPSALARQLETLGQDEDLAHQLKALEAAIEANDTDTIDAIIGIRHAIDKPRKFASTQVQLSEAITEKLFAIGREIPDEDLADDGREDDAHVTVRYGLENDDPSDVEALLANWGAISLTLGPLDYFSAPDYDVVFAGVASPDLVELHEAISNQVECAESDHGAYRPHATIAYVRSGLGQTFKGRTDVAGMTATVDSVTFSASDSEKTEIGLNNSLETLSNPEGINQWTNVGPTGIAVKYYANDYSNLSTVGMIKGADLARVGAKEAHHALTKAGYVKVAPTVQKFRPSEKMGRSTAYTGSSKSSETQYAHPDGRMAVLKADYQKYRDSSVVVRHKNA